MDQVTFRVSERKKVALSVKTVSFRPFLRRGMTFIEELAVLWRLFSVFLCHFYK